MNEIVVGVDGSETARRAATKAAELAVSCDVGLHLVTTVHSARAAGRGGGESWYIDTLTAGEQLLRSLTVALPVDVITTSVQIGDPATVLCDEADRLDARMIVVGNRRLHSASRVLGSVASQVARHANCDVYVVNSIVEPDPGDESK